MTNRFYPRLKIGLNAVTVVVAATIFMSACTRSSATLEDDADSAMKAKMADEKVEEAKEQEEALVTEEERQFEEEKEEEKQEDADFEAVKKRLAEDEAEAELTRKFFDNEMLAINERLHHLSGRVEEISERLHSLAGLVEHLPSKVAALEVALKQGLTRPKEAFWGVQVGAYNTRSGAKEGWNGILSNQAAVQLNDAKVQYFLSEPLKNGKRLTLIVINEYESRAAADSACNELKTVGVQCVAIRVTP